MGQRVLPLCFEIQTDTLRSRLCDGVLRVGWFHFLQYAKDWWKAQSITSTIVDCNSEDLNASVYVSELTTAAGSHKTFSNFLFWRFKILPPTHFQTVASVSTSVECRGGRDCNRVFGVVRTAGRPTAKGNCHWVFVYHTKRNLCFVWLCQQRLVTFFPRRLQASQVMHQVLDGRYNTLDKQQTHWHLLCWGNKQNGRFV